MKRLNFILLSLALLFGTICGAQPGFIDKSYGDNGTVVSNLGQSEVVYDAIRTSAGQIVICGLYTDYNNINSSFVARYSEDGTLDNIFGIAGKTILSYPNRKINAVSLDRQSDGKYIVAGGTVINNQPSIFVCRLDTNGNLDNTFGNAGFAFYTNDSFLLVSPNAVVTGNDKIFFGATTLRNANGLDMAFVRFLKDGTLDVDYGMQGLHMIDLNSGSDEITSFAKADDGSFYAVGFSYHTDQPLAAAFKFTQQGELDATFGNNGLTLVQADGSYASGIDEQGKLYMAGNIMVNGYNMLSCIRFLPNGQLDNTFGTNGTATMAFRYEYPVPRSILFGPEGRVTIGGYLRGKYDYDALLCRFLSNGKPDSAFSFDGQVMANLTHVNEEMRVLLPHSSGNILLIGSALDYPNLGNILIASYQTRFGLGDENVQEDGLRIYPNPGDGLFNLSLNVPVQKVVVLNSSGTTVNEINGYGVKNLVVEVDGSSGFYWLEVYTLEGTVLREKVVKY